jgi:CheY-like chemotaxis protein
LEENRSRVVLVAEDEEDNREIVRSVVEDLLGYRALLAANGSAAVEVAALRRPGLILMDLMMPVMDGFEAIKQIKANPSTKDIPIVAVTAMGARLDRERALGEGAAEYLVKPFDLDQLVDIIQRHLEPESEELEA